MPASYFEVVLRQFATTPYLRDELLAGTQIILERLLEPGAEITLGQLLKALRNLNGMRPGGWALSVGAAFHASTHGPLGFAAVSAPTLGDALDLIARYMHVRNPSHRAEAGVQGGEYRLALLEQTLLLEDERIPLVETFLLSAQSLVEAVLSRRLEEARFEFRYPAPPWAYRYPEVFHSEVRFDAPQSALVMPSTLRAVRSPHSDPTVYASSLLQLEASARRIDGADVTAARVEQLLVQGGDAPLPLAAAARGLGLSRRTLIRRLHEGGTSYRDLSDAHRRRRAETLLREGRHTVAEVGHRLGYEDASNFGRACRRWFGATPGELRRGGVTCSRE